MIKRINIGYFADGPWSHRAFEKLIKDEEINIRFIVPRSDTQDETLKKFATHYGIDYLHPVKVNDPDFINKIRNYQCDVLVSMSFNQIFRKEIIESTPLGIINCHAGKLPFYRGRNILNWALINDEKDFGITTHFVDEGIDTGDIILQKNFPITENDSYASLLEVAYVECAFILYESIKLIQESQYKRIKQETIHSIGFYCGIRGEGDEIINWNQTSRKIFNFIRAINSPGPQATTYFDGNEIKINSSKLINGAPDYIGTPGQVIAKTKEGFLIKTKDNFIEILEINSNIKLRVGMKLQNS